MNITREILDKLKKVSLKEFLEDRYGVKFRRVSGSTFNAHCPHPDHEDINPSFSVWTDNKNNWYWCCHGCHCDNKNIVQKNYGTDFIALIQWLSDYKRSPHIYSFQEAVKEAANYAGIDISSCYKTVPVSISKLYKENEKQAENYHSYLLNYKTPAYDYLAKERRLTKTEVKAWKLGYDGNRIIFPLIDRQGRIIGFSKRVLNSNNADEAKYINSPNSKIFNKSSYLYGIDKLNSSLDYIIVTEGQMDVIASYKYGLQNVVATLGTAFTKEHIEYLIMNYKKIENIIFAFDNDNAGLKALDRAAQLAIEAGFSVSYVILPDNTDLFDFATKNKDKTASLFFSMNVPYYYRKFQNDIEEYDRFIANFNDKVIKKAEELSYHYRNLKEKKMLALFIKNKFGISLLNNNEQEEKKDKYA